MYLYVHIYNDIYIVIITKSSFYVLFLNPLNFHNTSKTHTQNTILQSHKSYP